MTVLDAVTPSPQRRSAQPTNEESRSLCPKASQSRFGGWHIAQREGEAEARSGVTPLNLL
jgi:hypothetical protein